MKDRDRMLLFFVTGFLIGILYIVFFQTAESGMIDFLSIQNLIQIPYAEMIYKDYFLFLLKKRMAVLGMLLLSSAALPGKYLMAGFLMLFGCGIGGILSVLITRCGIKGFFLTVALLFPQYLFYIPALFGLCAVLSKWHSTLFSHGSMLRERRQKKTFLLGKGLLYLGVTIMGLLCECYVNPNVVIFCLKIF